MLSPMLFLFLLYTASSIRLYNLHSFNIRNSMFFKLFTILIPRDLAVQ